MVLMACSLAQFAPEPPSSRITPVIGKSRPAAKGLDMMTLTSESSLNSSFIGMPTEGGRKALATNTKTDQSADLRSAAAKGASNKKR